MKLLSLIASPLLFAFLAVAAPDFQSVRTEAERAYAEKSFARANELYRTLDVTNLPAADRRWVEFRLADTAWRSAAASDRSDTTVLDKARADLNAMVRDTDREQDQDRVWAEVEESLGDYFWTRRESNDFNQALSHYQLALDWWAGAPDIEAARARYLAIVWRMSRPPWAPIGYGYWGNGVPLPVLENAVKIAPTKEDAAHAHYLLAMGLRYQGGNWVQRARVPAEFEAALAAGKGSDWYDDALYQYGEWMLNQGRVVPLNAIGNFRNEPDYAKALELFRRLVTEFKKGETRYWEQAQAQIRNITEPQLSLSVPNIFLPGSEIQYQLAWRNVKQISLALYPVDLNRDVRLEDGSRNRPDWLQSINLASKQPVQTWTYAPRGFEIVTNAEGLVETNSFDPYRPGDDAPRLESKLKPGAYVLEASANGRRARDIVLVTDAVLVLKTSGRQALVYVCNALDGSPLPEARVVLRQTWADRDRWHSRSFESSADTNGLAVFELESDGRGAQIFASALHGDRQSFSLAGQPWSGQGIDNWRVYAYTDRPAYRPGETVQWKFTARRSDGAAYSTPSDQTLNYEITDPRGAKVKSDKVQLNALGSAWGTLPLTGDLPLGEYRATFWTDLARSPVGTATLFRLEEYKLPEFKVTVTTPEETGPGGLVRKKSFRLGDTVEAVIQADYYFGGPVSDATVEVLVHQSPWWQTWTENREYPWLYQDASRFERSYGDQVVKRETLKTDAFGRATVRIETPAGDGQDLQYRIEARVTDSSRREIAGVGMVRVTRQRYQVHLRPDHQLFRPQDRVKIEVKALDPNEQPVVTEGTVKVTRDYWYEIWRAPDGREVKGRELEKLRAGASIWPPRPERPDQREWRLVFRGYEHEDVLQRTLKTGTNGIAEMTFTAPKQGYYSITWSSRDAQPGDLFPEQISASTTVWVADNRATELGYRHDGIQIIADQDTFRVGQKAPVMLVSPAANRYALFCIEGTELYNWQLVHFDGTVKLIEVPIEEKHVPNITLSALQVADQQIQSDAVALVVPPTRNFLTVDLQPDRAAYEPRQEGMWTVTTRDDSGKPVSAEVALGVVDDSVYYIQSDYAGDPRRFFFGQLRPLLVQTASTMNQRAYRRLLFDKQLGLRDERHVESGEADRWQNARREDFDDKSELRYAFGGSGGGGAFMAKTRGMTGRAMLNEPAAVTPMSATAQSLAVDAVQAAPANAAGEEESEAAVQVRTDFRATALWKPDVVTGPDGKASVKIQYPDSLTAWRATARAVADGNRFGFAETNCRTRQPLIVRLECPRFFVVGDLITLSAVVNNNTDQPFDVKPSLEIAGGLELTVGQTPVLHVPANGQARADWNVQARTAGEVKLKVTGRGGKYSDAMEKSFTIYEHGLDKLMAVSGKTRGPESTFLLELPAARKPGSTSLTVQITPSLAVTMLDALPYLVDYPYGCTEQTMSRFLPTVIATRTLSNLGLDAQDVMNHAFGGIEPGSAQTTHPKGKHDLAEIDRITQESLDRLYDFQHSDGGWGWWKEGDSDHWMTAYVVWGLSLASDAGLGVRGDLLDRGAAFLDKTLVEEEDAPDMQAFMLHALAAYDNLRHQAPSAFQSKAFTNVWNRRDSLNAYTRALLALAAHGFHYDDKAKILVQNLENGVIRDTRPDASVLQPATRNPQPATLMETAHWGEDGLWWRWSEGGVEATAFALQALVAIDPTNALVEPVTNWLLKNRRGAQWNSTRDTAIVVLALNDYLRASGELKSDVDYELIVNGKSVAKRHVAGADVFNAPSRVTIDPALVREHNVIEVKARSGGKTVPGLYVSAEARFFSTEEPITAAGNELFVRRQYFKLVGRPTLLKGYVYDRVPLEDGQEVRSGERVETVLTLESKNNYEYLMIEDLKPAGLEAVELRSGENLDARELRRDLANARPAAATAATWERRPDSDFTGRTRWVYRELRDRKVALFLDRLPEGIWEIHYELRAETPGTYHALPAVGQAMYVPEIRGNSAELRIRVDE
ncbi:MAG: alpha-2-macroglobulin family protein [Verrucomicrobiota bacterium]